MKVFFKSIKFDLGFIGVVRDNTGEVFDLLIDLPDDKLKLATFDFTLSIVILAEEEDDDVLDNFLDGVI